MPILQKLSEDPYGVFCLVLTPTRELAYQIADQFSLLGKPIGLRHAVIVGGMGKIIIMNASFVQSRQVTYGFVEV